MEAVGELGGEECAARLVEVDVVAAREPHLDADRQVVAARRAVARQCKAEREVLSPTDGSAPLGGPTAARRPPTRTPAWSARERREITGRDQRRRAGALVVVAHLHLRDDVVRHRERKEAGAADRRADLDPCARAVPRKRRPKPPRSDGRSRSFTRRRSSAPGGEMVSPGRVQWSTGSRASPDPAVVVVRVVVVVRMFELIATSTLAWFAISVLSRVSPAGTPACVVGRLGVAGVLPRGVCDLPCRRPLKRWIAALDARLPVLAYSMPAANAPASARFWSCRLCVYQLPTSTTRAVISRKTGIITAASTITCPRSSPARGSCQARLAVGCVVASVAVVSPSARCASSRRRGS